MTISIKIVLVKKPRKDGKYPIKLRVTKDKKNKWISLNMYCAETEFANEQFKRSMANYRRKNQILLKLKTRALEIVDDYILKGENFTIQDFENKFRGNELTKTQINAITFFNEIIEEMKNAGRMSSAKAYKDTRNTLIKFRGNDILLKDITVEFLEKLETYMRSRGNENGGIAFKMREIRTLYNKAIMRGLISQERYPFKYYKIAKLKSKKNKRALKLEDFKRIRDVDLKYHKSLEEALNYFLFSFYTRGMNFADMMLLKWTDIVDGRILYTRSKTKGYFSIEITEKVQEILDYYKAQNRTTKYVFPILLKDDLTPLQIANRKHKVLSRYNSKLKRLAKIAKVESKLTSYVARHSFATILKQIGTSTDVISELMGHSDVQITMTYLKEFDNEVLDKENRKLMDL